jgi:hypothetical protein
VSAAAKYPPRIVGSARLCGNSSVGHLAPHPSNTVCQFPGKSFPRVRAVMRRGRGALRYQRWLYRANHATPRWSQRPVGGGTAFRREAAALEQAGHQTASLRTHRAVAPAQCQLTLTAACTIFVPLLSAPSRPRETNPAAAVAACGRRERSLLAGAGERGEGGQQHVRAAVSRGYRPPEVRQTTLPESSKPGGRIGQVLVGGGE